MRRALRTKEIITKKKAQIIYSAQVLIYLMHFPLSVLTKQRLNNNAHLFIHFAIDITDVKYSYIRKVSLSIKSLISRY